MKPRICAIALAILLTAACSKGEERSAPPAMASYELSAPQISYGKYESHSADAAESAADAAAGAAAAASEAAASAAEAVPKPATSSIPPGSIGVGMPKIAYVYDYGYRIDADEISALQRRHADLCEKQGPQVCRILEMRQSGEEGEYASGSLALAVASPRARSFGVELAKAADSAGGKEVSSSITGEDLSKQIVDTEARLRARSLLRDRLMEVLATRKGTVAELVEAERGVAQVNEEIDEARSWLAEMRGRVDFSRVNVSYTSGAPQSGGFLAPIRAVFGSLGEILGMTIAGIIVLLTAALPIALVVWAGRQLWKRFKLWRRRNDPVEPAESSEVP